MRWLLVVVLFAACAPAAAAPIQTEDPRVAVLQTQVDQLHAALDVAQNTPTFSMWNLPYTFRDGQYEVLGLPDTFTTRIRFSATAPVRVRIMDVGQFAKLLYTGSGDGTVYPSSASFDVTFHGAEGCAAYVLVLDAPGGTIVTPDLTISRVAHPGTPTGFCRE